jgi:hypothetical protein
MLYLYLFPDHYLNHLNHLLSLEEHLHNLKLHQDLTLKILLPYLLHHQDYPKNLDHLFYLRSEQSINHLWFQGIRFGLVNILDVENLAMLFQRLIHFAFHEADLLNQHFPFHFLLFQVVLIDSQFFAAKPNFLQLIVVFLIRHTNLKL